MTMRELTYQVSFNTPAFLGNAEQHAQWRTPPFKALLRQWWRVVKALEVGYDHRRLLGEEQALFGSAGDDAGGGRSKVQLRLSDWSPGAMSQRPALQRVDHPETKTRDGRPIRPDADVYLGFGPITLDAMRPAIAPAGPAVTLKLRCPKFEVDNLRKAMQLAAWFGIVGSRARNGWGSLNIQGESLLGYDDLTEVELLKRASASSLVDALKLDWPHGFAKREDGKLAVWRVGKINRQEKSIDGFGSWREAMEELARIKIGFRTALKFPEEATPHDAMQDRHVLAYPVTNHKIRGISDDKRLSSSLRFKVHERGAKFFAVITHVPCGIPRAFMPNPPSIEFQQRVWSTVHQVLDTKFPERVTRIKKGVA